MLVFALMAMVMCTAVTTTLGSDGDSHPCSRRCVADQPMTCRYNFTLEWYRTLGKACYDCPFNVTDCYRPHCVTADGKVRAVIAVNRQVPGPPIEVCLGDRVEVAITNMLDDGLATSMHWHGQHVQHEAYFDGVGGITQCNIQHLETFVYRFQTGPAGTHWYHAHTGLQLADGAFGPLIVRQPQGQDPNDNLYDHDLSDHVLTLYDWAPDLAIARQLDLMHLFDSLPLSVLVNGRGRRYPVTDPYGLVDTNLTEAFTPLEVLHVQQGHSYRLRVISAAPTCPMQVSVDEHQLQVISVDGMPLVPRTLDAFIIHPGERYDFVLSANRDEDTYWLRVLGLGDCEGTKANGAAILHYQGAEVLEPMGDPTTNRDGTLLNPILYDGEVAKYGFNRSVILLDELQYVHPTNFTNEQVDFKYIIGMDYNNNDNSRYNHKEFYSVQTLKPRMFHSTPVMDNITFILPPVPLLSERGDINEEWFCNRSTLADPEYCLDQDLCRCTHVVHVPLNKVVELIVYHDGRFFAEMGHNMHLHGHSFRLLGLGKVSTSLSRSRLEDMEAQGQLRRNFIQPSVRDTVNIPDGGYAVLRFVASNPGFWFFHCHTDGHLMQGMALLIRVGEYSDLPPIPSQFPRCGGMGYSNANREEGDDGGPATCPTSSSDIHVMSPVHMAMFSVCVLLRMVPRFR